MTKTVIRRKRYVKLKDIPSMIAATQHQPTFSCSLCETNKHGRVIKSCSSCKRDNDYENREDFADYFADCMNRDD